VTPPSAGTLAGSWGGDPGVLALLLVATALYVYGARRRPSSLAARSRGRDLAFAGAIVALAAALVSPLDTASQYLLWAHMAQHMLLALLAAPLLVVSTPVRTMERALPLRARRVLARTARRPAVRAASRVAYHPLVAFFLFAATWWAWHTPALYDAAVRNGALHALEHLTFLATGVLWWGCIVGPHRAPVPQRLALTIATALHMNVLGALVTLAPHAVYGAYRGAYGLSALEDQQLAGVLMWVVGGFVSLGTVLALVVTILREEPEPAGPVAAPRLVHM
jgi:cytochrome c oxidase assembly factor CtaG